MSFGKGTQKSRSTGTKANTSITERKIRSVVLSAFFTILFVKYHPSFSQK